MCHYNMGRNRNYYVKMLSHTKNRSIGTDQRTPMTLHNKDFTSGTYRITKPGLYVVQEDIVFAPNIDNFCKPKVSQILISKRAPRAKRSRVRAARDVPL